MKVFSVFYNTFFHSNFPNMADKTRLTTKRPKNRTKGFFGLLYRYQKHKAVIGCA
jgi:hypothetical protein